MREDSHSFTAEEITLALVPKFSAFLSACGSSFIMHDVVRTGQVLRSTHHRLLLGMSSTDFLVSVLAFFTSTWLAPIDAIPPVYGAAGNQATCTAQGFFAHFSLTVALYNAALSTFYLAQIRYRCKTQFIETVLEPFFHLIPLAVGIGTSSAGVFLNLYNSEGWECWIANLPPNCQESWNAHDGQETTCLRGDNASLYRWVLYYAILWLAILTVSVNMVLVYLSVYAQEKAMEQYNFEYQQEKERMELEGGDNNEEEEAEEDEASLAGSVCSNHSSSSMNRNNNKLRSSSSLLVSAAWYSVSKSLSSVGSVAMRRSRRRHLTRAGPSFASQQQPFRHSRRVARQGYWFCGAFMATWIFPSITRLVQVAWQSTPFPLMVLTAFFVPIQGFFNFIVWTHPRFKKWKETYSFCCPKWHLCCCCSKNQHQNNNLQGHHQDVTGAATPRPANNHVVAISSLSAASANGVDFNASGRMDKSSNPFPVRGVIIKEEDTSNNNKSANMDERIGANYHPPHNSNRNGKERTTTTDDSLMCGSPAVVLGSSCDKQKSGNDKEDNGNVDGDEEDKTQPVSKNLRSTEYWWGQEEEEESEIHASSRNDESKKNDGEALVLYFA